MAVIPLPARFGFSELPTFTLMRASNEVRSRYTAVRQILTYPYAVFMLEGTLVELDGIEAGRMRSFLAKLKGKQNTFRLPVPGYYRPSTGYAGDGFAQNPAASRATSLVLGGMVANVPVLREGEYVTINDECKMITEDCASTSNGQCVINFEPAFRKPVIANSPVKLQKPTILMHSQDDSSASWSIKAPTRQASKFRAIEAIQL
jgi:hypothetical protein